MKKMIATYLQSVPKEYSIAFDVKYVEELEDRIVCICKVKVEKGIRSLEFDVVHEKERSDEYISYEKVVQDTYKKAINQVEELLGRRKEEKNSVEKAEEKPQPKKQVHIEIPEPKTPLEKGAELKETYGIRTKSQFVAFARIWNPNIKDFSDITPQVIEELHAYVLENPDQFEDFEPDLY